MIPKKIIMGIDPGSQKTGYAVIQQQNSKIDFVASGFIQLKTKCLASRLEKIFCELQKILSHYQPIEVAIEKIFYSINVQSSFTLAHTRGVILLCCKLQKSNIFEFTPKEIKKSATGNGNATKNQVLKTMHLLFKTPKTISLDESDALATAICCAHHSTTSKNFPSLKI